MYMHDGQVVSNFIVQALQNAPITIYGDGSQAMDFCCVDDMIEGFVRLMESEDGFTVPVYLGNLGEFTIKGPAEQVLEMTGSKSKLEFFPLPDDDPQQRKSDIDLAQGITGLGTDSEAHGRIEKDH